MSKKKRVSDLGEFGLIDKLIGVVHQRTNYDMFLTIGDDAAVWRMGTEFVVASTDALVEGTHFIAGQTPWSDVGWKALAVNVSDIAAMGARAKFALITLALPSDTLLVVPIKIYRGLKSCWQWHSVSIAGGDTVKSPTISIGVTVVGQAKQRNGKPLLLLRETAEAGDVIAVTGTLGDSAAGLRLLKSGASPYEKLVRRHLRPKARSQLGELAVEAGLVCGIDVSDGLLQDISQICKRSHVGAVVYADRIPMGDAIRHAFPEDALRLACTGGEDYELVFVGKKEIVTNLISTLEYYEEEVPVTIVGEIVPDAECRVVLLNDADNEIIFDRPGWDAFQ